MNLYRRLITQEQHIAPLAVFRVLFGLMMLVSMLRFAYRGWIDSLYIQPSYFFTYYGFEWVQPLGDPGMYLLFAVMGLAALGVMLGAFYRISAILFFLSFSYVELIDITNYLNHYYFVSLVSLCLIFVPANRAFSVDTWRKPDLILTHVPAWCINLFKLQLVIVYFYAGIAKLNYDWLVLAMPLKLWLPAQAHVPVVGYFLNFEWTAYLFSWFGAIYDLTVAFFLLYRPTRIWAYAAVVVFHAMTALLFQIGMFPYIMMVLTLLFFSEEFHENLIQRLAGGTPNLALLSSNKRIHPALPKLGHVMLGLYVAFQLIFPFRYQLYPGNLFWTEQGYRFSWRVMLMEKAGYTVFNVYDPISGKREQANNLDYLSPNQEKMMSTQPDLILQFAHFLEGEYKKKGFVEPEIRAESYVTLNGRRSRRYVDPEVDLTKVEEGFQHKEWILAFEEKEKTKFSSEKSKPPK